MEASQQPPTSKRAILDWCRGYVAELLDATADSLDPNADFDKLGLDSALSVSLLVEIEERFGLEVQPEALFENPTLDALAEYLYQRQSPQVA